MTPREDAPRPDAAPSRNVALPPGFGDRLRALREERHLSKNDLAARAGLAWRTVHNLESDVRENAQQKSLLLIASALEIPYGDLLGDAAAPGEPTPPDAPARPTPQRPRVRARVLVPVVLAALVAAAVLAEGASRDAARVVREDLTVVARDPVLGRTLWTLPLKSVRCTIRIAPWDPTIVLLNAPIGERHYQPLQARDRATGELLWWVEPDTDQLVRALGDEVMEGYPMGCCAFDFGDIDGDGALEIVAVFRHSRNYPAAVCLVNRDGRRLRQYANRGHLMAVAVADIDGDGKDEALATGVNNAPAYNGPTVIALDDTYWSGASVDSLCNPGCSEPDSSLARVVFGTMPEEYQAVMGSLRISGNGFQVVSGPDGVSRIALQTYSGRQGTDMNIVFDNRFNPLSADISDTYRGVLLAAGADSLLDSGPANEAWREAWVAGAGRFGAGTMGAGR